MDTIEYFEHPLLPGRKMFRCDKLHATMQTSSCGERWSVANENSDGVYSACVNCPLGAQHAGVGEINRSPLRGALVCARCHMGATRLIRRHLCVSCMNRQYEVLKGRNARGGMPKKLRQFDRRRLATLVDGKVRVRVIEHTADQVEMFVAELRDTMKPMAFGFVGQPQGRWSQLRLL